MKKFCNLPLVLFHQFIDIYLYISVYIHITTKSFSLAIEIFTRKQKMFFVLYGSIIAQFTKTFLWRLIYIAIGFNTERKDSTSKLSHLTDLSCLFRFIDTYGSSSKFCLKLTYVRSLGKDNIFCFQSSSQQFNNFIFTRFLYLFRYLAVKFLLQGR